MEKETTYTVNGVTYIVKITYKPIKNIIFKFRNDCFVVSAPRLTSVKTICKCLDGFAPSLIKRSKKVSPIESKTVYILGVKKVVIQRNDLYEGEYLFKYKDEEDLYEKLKRIALPLLEKYTKEAEEEMGIKKKYGVKIRKMDTRYGTNSRRTHAITYSLKLIHFHPDVIKAIVVHELAHDKYFDHSKAFYDYLYSYYPRYDEAIKHLNKGDYEWNFNSLR